MNRRNFVVGLGTVATISGVASVTAAQFAESVSPTADFRVRPENAELSVDLTPNFDTVETYWSEQNLTDFNETEDTASNVTAHLNNSSGTNDNLVATLTFNNTNLTGGSNGSDDVYDEYAHPTAAQIAPGGTAGDGFFEVNNNGETTETVGITFDYGDAVVNGDISEQEVADAFQFFMQDDADSAIERISPTSSDPANPANYAEIGAGDSEIVGLEINVHDALYNAIQAEAGGAFTQTATNLQLISGVNVGIEEGT